MKHVVMVMIHLRFTDQLKLENVSMAAITSVSLILRIVRVIGTIPFYDFHILLLLEPIARLR